MTRDRLSKIAKNIHKARGYVRHCRLALLDPAWEPYLTELLSRIAEKEAEIAVLVAEYERG
ncbi:MAG: hypothetical protein V4475_06780 [Pseudomonadota bacterium]